MATIIAKETSSREEVVATAVVLLGLSTAGLGLVVRLVGKLRLATVVSFIPAPVIAGYLAFIGFFCLAAGLGLAVNEDIAEIPDFLKLLHEREEGFLLPALLSGLFLSLVSRNAREWYVLPGAILAVGGIFYLFLCAFGVSLEEARAAGWVAPMDPVPPTIHRVLHHFDFHLVQWRVAPKLFVTWLSMTLFVTFASALDVVAVELDMEGTELDLDQELITVGWSNVISGLLAGYTGSYIFSQTIFTRRTLAKTRRIGMVLALSELGLFAAPISLTNYVPRYFFAATLIFIALDLLYEWLYLFRFRVSHREYMLVLLTFVTTTLTQDLLLGIFYGTVGAILNFIFAYAEIDPVVRKENETTSSNVVRDFESRKLLAGLAPTRIVVLRVTGYLFFGSSTMLLRRVKSLLSVSAGGGGETHAGPRTTYGTTEAGVPEVPLKYLILDMAQITGMDATAVSTGLARVKALTKTHPLRIVFTGLSPAHETLLRTNGILKPEDAAVTALDCLDDGLDDCETRLLQEAWRDAPNNNSSTLGSVVLDLLQGTRRNLKHLTQPVLSSVLWEIHDSEFKFQAVTQARREFSVLVEAFFGWGEAGEPSLSSKQTRKLAEYFRLTAMRRNDVLFDEGETSDELHVVVYGEMCLYRCDASWLQTASTMRLAKARSEGMVFGKGRSLLQRARFGSLVGDLGFALQMRRLFGAVCTKDAIVFSLSREALARMEREDPSLAVGLFKVIGRSLGLSLVNVQQFSFQARELQSLHTATTRANE